MAPSPSPSPHHRHQSSLEGIIHFSTEPPLDEGHRAQAKKKFYNIVNHFEVQARDSDPYDRPKLVRLTYEYARSEQSQDIFLRAFFQAIAVSIDDEDVDLENDEELGLVLTRFADYLFENFFLPLRASAKKTPQLSPAFHSAVQQTQGRGTGAEDFVGTPGRVSELRGACLTRDRHRCIISRQFNMEEAEQRIKTSGHDATDDDGKLLLDEAGFDSLEVAHILPHALTRVDANSELHPSKKAALDILNMFDHMVIHMIEGDEIDRPRNALTLTPTLHNRFGDFKIFFQADDEIQHTYRIDSFYPLLMRGVLPVTRTLYLAKSRSIDPPSPRLLALHCAIAHILHLSAAGSYIDQILKDMENKAVRADGSTELGRLVTLRMGWDQVAYA